MRRTIMFLKFQSAGENNKHRQNLSRPHALIFFLKRIEKKRQFLYRKTTNPEFD